jgi:hypothetical protein
MTKDDHLARIKGSAQMVRSDTSHAASLEKFRATLVAVAREFAESEVRQVAGAMIPNLERAATLLDYPRRKDELREVLELVPVLMGAIETAAAMQQERLAGRPTSTPPILRPLGRAVGATA